MQMSILLLQLQNMIIKLILPYPQLMFLTQNMHIVILIFLLANPAVRMFFIRLRKIFFRIFLKHIPDMTIMLTQLLFLISCYCPSINTQDKSRGVVFFIEVENWKCVLGCPGFSVVFGAELNRSIEFCF